jgi:hypothetical protein
MQELPAHHSVPYGSSGEDYACAHGAESGYLRCIETMKLLARPTQMGEPVATFEKPENEDY